MRIKIQFFGWDWCWNVSGWRIGGAIFWTIIFVTIALLIGELPIYYLAWH